MDQTASSIPSSENPPSSVRQMPTKEARSSPYCTHRTLTRLYDSSGCLKCMVCQRVPDLGYLYRCTQETNGHLLISDFVNEDLSTDLRDFSVSTPSNTAGSVDMTSGAVSSHGSGDTMADNTASSANTMDNQAATDEALAQACDGKRKFEAAFPPPPVEEANRCNLRICVTCRPGYKDRAWQSLNEVVDNPVNLPSQLELDNRRISDASTILAMQPARARLQRENTNADFVHMGPPSNFSYFGTSDSDSDSDDGQEATSHPSRASSPEIIVDSPMHGEGSDGSDADDEKDADGDSFSNDSGTDVTIDLEIDSDGVEHPHNNKTGSVKKPTLRRTAYTINGGVKKSGPTPGRFVID